ncbi:unnamed protein product [Calypogeia fissa]
MPPLKWLSSWSVVGFFFVISTLCISLAGGTTLRSGSGSLDVQDVGVNTTVTFQPVYLEGSNDSVPEIVAASRVRIPGWSRLQRFDQFHHTFRVKIEIATYRIIFGRHPRLSLGDCGNGTWWGYLSIYATHSFEDVPKPIRSVETRSARDDPID